MCKNEKPDKAIELLKEAFKRFHDDPFFAQQLARLHYKHEMFEEAEHWAETAARQLPNNSYILDTKGQVYKKFSLQLFANGARGDGECLKYLCSDYIPEELKDDWEPFHDRLTKLYKTVEDALGY